MIITKWYMNMKNSGSIVKPKDYFLSLFEKYGVDEKSLGWSKHKQKFRFRQVCSYVDNGNSVLDIGCGFADLYDYLASHYRNIEYYGVDIMSEYIDVALSKYNEENVHLCCATIDNLPWKRKYDWVIECGLFGLRQFDDDKMYEYIDETLRKALDLSEIGVSYNFMSDKVDYMTSDTDFHVSPEKILSIAYKYSRRIVLDNSILPFEYSITVWKNDSFAKETTVFRDVEGIQP